MNKVIEVLNKEKRIKKYKEENGYLDKFSRVLLFAGEEFNKKIEQINQEKKFSINIIDFEKHRNPESVKKQIIEIYRSSSNDQIWESNQFPIIWFKNVEKVQNQSLEEFLLPIFDEEQNTALFEEKIDLSKFILIATTTSKETEKLSDPLLSRLDWVNAETAQTKKFFWDKKFNLIFGISLLVNLLLIVIIFVPKCKKHFIKWKCKCSNKVK